MREDTLLNTCSYCILILVFSFCNSVSASCNTSQVFPVSNASYSFLPCRGSNSHAFNKPLKGKEVKKASHQAEQCCSLNPSSVTLNFFLPILEDCTDIKSQSTTCFTVRLFLINPHRINPVWTTNLSQAVKKKKQAGAKCTPLVLESVIYHQ